MTTIKNLDKPAVLVFSLQEFLDRYNMAFENFPKIVADSPFYMYDQSLNDVGPKFPDEDPVTDEDCDIGFGLLETIWRNYVARADTPYGSHIFKIMTKSDEEGFYVAPTYGFLPGYSMEKAKQTILDHGFEIVTWDEFWNEEPMYFYVGTPDSDDDFSDEDDSENPSDGVRLLVKTDASEDMHQTSFGGLPVKERNSSFEWPKCACGAELQYQGKIKTDIGYEMIFMQNCDDWGGDKVIVVTSDDLEYVHPTNSQMALRETHYSTKIVVSDDSDYDTARENYPARRRDVLGQIAGNPSWIQDDEIPNCDCCNKEMRFVAQLEEGPDHETAMNFGGGCGYLFDCEVGKTAKFVVQN